MSIRPTLFAATVLSVVFAAVPAAQATLDKVSGGLAGRIFAVDAEVTLSLDPAFPAGTTFQNCYYFNEDGTWFDPLFPDFGIAVPGGWIQHTELPKISYTATVAASDETFGLTLIQSGTVGPPRGAAMQKIRAYTTVWVGALPVVEVLSNGRSVDECPYF